MNRYTPIETLRNKLDAMTKRHNECRKELRALRKEMKAMQTSTNKSLDEFRKAVGSNRVNHKNKKRRLERESTPPNFWNLNF